MIHRKGTPVLKSCEIRVLSTEKGFLIRVPQYWKNGHKGGCRGIEYSKTPKIPLLSSTGLEPNTIIYHNACKSVDPIFRVLPAAKQQVMR